MAQNPSGLNPREVMILTSIRESFEAALARGEDWSIESRLELVPDRLQHELLRELLQCELATRNVAGPTPIDEYLKRFPDSKDIVRSVFESWPDASAKSPDNKQAPGSGEGEDGNLDATRIYDRESLELERRQAISSAPHQK
mgnify:CR=1 FL=1